MNLLSILLQIGQQDIIMFGLFGLIVYFFMIRPQQTKTKAAKTFREGLKKGDTIVTIGGVYGKIISFEDDEIVIVEIASTVKVKFEKSAISMEASQKVQQKEEKAAIA